MRRTMDGIGFVGGWAGGLRTGSQSRSCDRLRVRGFDGGKVAGRARWPGNRRRRASVAPMRMSEKDDSVAESLKNVDKGPYFRQLAGWVAVAVAAAVGIYFVDGGVRAQEFVAGYIVEQSLSVDNLFVFLLIFNYFQVPIHSQEKVLNWGIFGAVVMRGIMIVTGEEMIAKFDFTTLFLGGLLFYSSVNILLSGDEEEDLENNTIVKVSKRFLKTVDYYDGDKFFTQVKGVGGVLERVATPLLICLVVVEISDIVFALDSVPAVLGISRDTKVIYLSNILAICGLRSMYFILESLIGTLRYLPQSLAVVLAFVGAKLCGSYFDYNIDTTVSLGVVVSCLAVGIAASLINPEDPSPEGDAPK